MSRSYRSQTTSPYGLHRRWIEQDMQDMQDMDQNYVDEMKAYDWAQYYAEQDGCPAGTDSAA